MVSYLNVERIFAIMSEGMSESDISDVIETLEWKVKEKGLSPLLLDIVSKTPGSGKDEDYRAVLYNAPDDVQELVYSIDWSMYHTTQLVSIWNSLNTSDKIKEFILNEHKGKDPYGLLNYRDGPDYGEGYSFVFERLVRSATSDVIKQPSEKFESGLRRDLLPLPSASDQAGAARSRWERP